MKKTINTIDQSVTFTFEGLDAVTINASEVHDANRTYAMLHGLAARIGDNAAITKSVENNFTVTEAMRREAVMELVTHYAGGSEDWNVKAKAASKKQNPFMAQIAAKRGCTYDEAEAWYNAKLMQEMGAM